jgi:hypothetical protein
MRTNHEVIRRWAEERDAVPVTVPGTEHGHRLGVLRFEFPGYGAATTCATSAGTSSS